MKSERDQLPEDVISQAVDRLTAAILTFTMENLHAKSGYISGDVPDVVRAKVLDAYESTLRSLWK
jgi:hypothetical protein